MSTTKLQVGYSTGTTDDRSGGLTLSKSNGSNNWRWLYFRKAFHDKIRTGVKTHTLRNQRIPPGTRVACPVGLLEIVDVVKRTPAEVAVTRWREEGCESPEDFMDKFQSIQPDASPNEAQWLHVFRLVVPA